MTKRKTLVILTPGFAKDEADSTCIPLQQSFLLSLKKNYPHINIIILAFQYPYHTNTYEWHGMTVIPFNGLKKRRLQKLWLRKKIMVALKRIRSEYTINGILSYWFNECALVGKRFASRYGIRHFCWISGQDARKMNKYPRKLKAVSGELIALSDFLQDEFERNHGIRPLHVVPAGIDRSLYPSIFPEKDIDVMAAGSLIPLKQYEIFITIIAELKKKMPGIKAMLIGDGPEKQKLEKFIFSLGLQVTISMTGELPHPEVVKQMMRAKIFLHPSSYEGFSGVCLEAIGAGAQVISFINPMRATIPHWQIATSEEDMITKTISILHDPGTDHSSVIPYQLDDSASKMIGLFKLKD